jgi:hypothetical protein
LWLQRQQQCGMPDGTPSNAAMACAVWPLLSAVVSAVAVGAGKWQRRRAQSSEPGCHQRRTTCHWVHESAQHCRYMHLSAARLSFLGASSIRCPTTVVCDVQSLLAVPQKPCSGSADAVSRSRSRYLLDLLRDTADSLQEARRGARTGAGKGGGVGLLAQQLRRFGQALAAIAVPHACNNPYCADLSARTETAAVSGKGSLCGGCRVAHFCSKGCLTSHWGLHKPVCKALAAAAAADAAAGGASRSAV